MTKIPSDAIARFAVTGVYDRVIHLVNKVLSDSKSFPISILQLADEPTFEEIKDHLLNIDKTVDLLYKYVDGSDLCSPCEKAKEYISDALQIVEAILTDDQQSFDEAVAKLDKRSFL